MYFFLRCVNFTTIDFNDGPLYVKPASIGGEGGGGEESGQLFIDAELSGRFVKPFSFQSSHEPLLGESTIDINLSNPNQIWR